MILKFQNFIYIYSTRNIISKVSPGKLFYQFLLLFVYFINLFYKNTTFFLQLLQLINILN